MEFFDDKHDACKLFFGMKKLWKTANFNRTDQRIVSSGCRSFWGTCGGRHPANRDFNPSKLNSFKLPRILFGYSKRRLGVQPTFSWCQNNETTALSALPILRKRLSFAILGPRIPEPLTETHQRHRKATTNRFS